METIRKNILRTITVVVFFALAAFAISCNNDEPVIGAAETANVASEAASEAYFEEVDNISSTVSLFNDNEFSQGRVAHNDDRFCDDTKIILLNKQPDNPDTIIVDFGPEGCPDPRGNVRKGKIIIVFVHEGRFAVGNSVTTTLVDFYINDVKFDGTRTVTYVSDNETAPRWEITLEGGKITWPDETFATRDAHHFRRWDRAINPLQDQFVIEAEGEASGVNRRGREYSMLITEDIVFKAACFVQHIYMPVSGVKVLTVGGKTATIDYGDGECDKIVTITINGETRNLTAERD